MDVEKASDSPPSNVTGTAPAETRVVPDNPGAEADPSAILALSMTGAIVAFIGALVVLTIPFAILSAPLPQSVNHLGLSVEISRGFLFERGWYLLVPSVLFALWIGYKFYQWGHTQLLATSAEVDREPPGPEETRHVSVPHATDNKNS